MSLRAFPQLLVNGLFTGSFYAMMALSWGIIFSTAKIFHFAHALVFTLAAYAAWLVSVQGAPIVASFLVAALVGAAAGVAIDRGLYRPLRRRNALQLNVFLASLGILLAGEAAIQYLFGVNARRIVGFDPSPLSIGRAGFTTLEVLVAVVSWAVIGVVAFILLRTRQGTAIRAVESNPDLARAMGISSEKVYRNVFIIGSAMAGIGGLLFALQETASPTMGVGPLLAAFIGVFVGGIGSILGAVLGGLLLGLAENMGGIFLPGHLQVIVAFVLLFGVLIIRPIGLFARDTSS
jgi:branched-chain amino acid transport system permease protein